MLLTLFEYYIFILNTLIFIPCSKIPVINNIVINNNIKEKKKKAKPNQNFF